MRKILFIILGLAVIGWLISGCEQEPTESKEEAVVLEKGTRGADSSILKANGDKIFTLYLPVHGSTGLGVAVNCEDPVTIYYNYEFRPYLYLTNKAGNNLGSVALADVNGNSISFGALAWDESRGMIWGGTDNRAHKPLSVYLINPTTGLCTYIFTMKTPGCCGFCDGLAFDGTDNSIWVSDDIATFVEHWDVSGIDASGSGTSSYIGAIYPIDASGNPMDKISGVAVGRGDLLYLGRNGYGQIVKVTKSGAYLGHFATATGRDEDLECDLISFAPLEILWSRDAYIDIIEAFEVEPGTCICGGVGDYYVPFDIKPTSCPNPLNVKSGGLLPVAILGTADFDVAQIDVGTVQLEGVDPIMSNNEDVATPFEPFSGKEDCNLDCNTYGPDGFMDLTLQFDKRDIVAALGEVEDGDCLVLFVTGDLLDGTPFIGEDVVLIKK